MTKAEFTELIGKDVVVDYPFFGEVQTWDMQNFYVDASGQIKHKYLPLIVDSFITCARNPHKGEATHGG